MKPQPPKWADRFLVWYCDPNVLEDLQGDLHEIYYLKQERDGARKASRLFIWLVLRSFRPSALRRNQKLKNSFFAMTRTNFKIALRVLWRDKFNTSINLLGLTIGIACFLLLGLYVKQELSYDHFHTKKDRIYRAWVKEDYGEGKTFFNSETPYLFENFFEENFPEMEEVVQYTDRMFLVGRGENRINEEVAIISPEFLNVFDFELIDGNKSDLLPGKRNLIISQSYAKKYFGDSDPIGKPLPIDISGDITDFTISGVFVDIPKESSIQFNLAVSSDNNKDFFGDRIEMAWFNVDPETYVLIKEGSTIESVEGKMLDAIMSRLGDEVERGEYLVGFQPLTDIHLNPDIPLGHAPVGNPQYVFILGAIGVLVLVIACINYTTLTAGQSLKRRKEVGVKKVFGAVRGTLVYQYLSESIILALFAMIIGTVTTFLLIPTFSVMTGVEIFYQFEWWHVGVYLVMALGIGLISGSYPALVISGFKTISILRGSLKSSGKLTMRKGLMVFQFMVTVFLISTTLIMSQQLNYLKDKDLGYNYKTVIAAQLTSDQSAERFTDQIESGMANGELLKAKLAKYPEISNIAMGSHLFGSNGWASLAYTDNSGAFRRFRLLIVDPDYLKSFGIAIKEGRDFDERNGLDARQSIILNETAAKYFGLENPIGDRLPGDNFGEHQIIGVTEDFHYSSLHSEVEPLIIVQNMIPIVTGVTDGNFIDSLVPKLVFTYTGTDLTEATAILKKEWEATFPNESWNYHFLDERIKAQYDEEARTNKLIVSATVLSIIIASLGLLGLTLLVVNNKVKEIGVRKILGASPKSIFVLLAKGFSIQLGIAIAISIPITIWLMNQWLENFAYRTEIGPMLFVISGLISMVIAFVVISYHTTRAAKVNPVESLRTE